MIEQPLGGTWPPGRVNPAHLSSSLRVTEFFCYLQTEEEATPMKKSEKYIPPPPQAPKRKILEDLSKRRIYEGYTHTAESETQVVVVYSP